MEHLWHQLREVGDWDSLAVTSAEVVNRESASESGLYFASRMLA